MAFHKNLEESRHRMRDRERERMAERKSVTYHGKFEMCVSDKCMPHFWFDNDKRLKIQMFWLWVMNVKFWSIILELHVEKRANAKKMTGEKKWTLSSRADARTHVQQFGWKCTNSKQDVNLCSNIEINGCTLWSPSPLLLLTQNWMQNVSGFQATYRTIPCMWYDVAIWK